MLQSMYEYPVLGLKRDLARVRVSVRVRVLVRAQEAEARGWVGGGIIE